MAFEKLYLRHHDDTECYRDVSSLFSHLATRCNFSGLIQFILFMQLQEEKKQKKFFQLEEISSFVIKNILCKCRKGERKKKLINFSSAGGGRKEKMKILGVGWR